VARCTVLQLYVKTRATTPAVSIVTYEQLKIARPGCPASSCDVRRASMPACASAPCRSEPPTTTRRDQRRGDYTTTKSGSVHAIIRSPARTARCSWPLEVHPDDILHTLQGASRPRFPLRYPHAFRRNSSIVYSSVYTAITPTRTASRAHQPDDHPHISINRRPPTQRCFCFPAVDRPGNRSDAAGMPIINTHTC
jgi:hypothetical protein